jgi:hypothetical protein
MSIHGALIYESRYVIMIDPSSGSTEVLKNRTGVGSISFSSDELLLLYLTVPFIESTLYPPLSEHPPAPAFLIAKFDENTPVDVAA